jgi:hypothetical protein
MEDYDLFRQARWHSRRRCYVCGRPIGTSKVKNVEIQIVDNKMCIDIAIPLTYACT